MNRRLDFLRLQCDQTPGAEAECRAAIEDYLDHLCAPLVGIAPYAVRQSLRLEVSSHLASLIEEYQWQGQISRDATEAALQEFGRPWEIGTSFLREWVQAAPGAASGRLTRQAAVHAFGCFGPLTVATLLLLDQYAMTPGCDRLLPYILLLAVLAPLLAGVLTGCTSSPRAGRGTFWAVSILALDTLATGLLLLPHQDGLKLALFQLAFWLPVGCLSASMTASVVRHHRRRQFLCLVRSDSQE